MNTLLWMLASTAAGWILGTRTSKRQIDARFREWEERMGTQPGAQPKAPAALAQPEAATPRPVAEQAAPAPATESEVPEEVLLVISAAVAAFLGKRARIRRIRRVPLPGFSPWSQQGRVYIQGSHNIWTRHGE